MNSDDNLVIKTHSRDHANARELIAIILNNQSLHFRGKNNLISKFIKTHRHYIFLIFDIPRDLMLNNHVTEKIFRKLIYAVFEINDFAYTFIV